MRRSSTSSSDAAPAAPVFRERRWTTFALLVGILLASAEVLLRIPEVRALLPPRTHYYHPAVVQRIDALERVKRVYGRVDVLFIGSSIVLTNVHPLLFDAIAAHQPHRLVSFNAGLAGLWPTSVHLYAEHVWLPLAGPRIVVQGVRYAEIAVPTHAKNDTQVWSGRVERSWRPAGLLTRLDAAAVRHVHLLQYQGALTKFMQRFQNGWVGPVDPDDDEKYAVRGYLPRGGPAITAADRVEADLPNDGTCADGRCRIGFEALKRTIGAVRNAGGTYVLVNVPEHASRWDEPGAALRYRAYVESLKRFAAAEGVRLIDPTDGNPWRFATVPYTDLSHMTAEGSRQFTRELALRMTPVLEAALPRMRALRATDESRTPAARPAGASGRRGPG